MGVIVTAVALARVVAAELAVRIFTGVSHHLVIAGISRLVTSTGTSATTIVSYSTPTVSAGSAATIFTGTTATISTEATASTKATASARFAAQFLVGSKACGVLAAKIGTEGCAVPYPISVLDGVPSQTAVAYAASDQSTRMWVPALGEDRAAPRLCRR